MMRIDDTLIERLRECEDRLVMPLLTDSRIEPIRSRCFELTLLPGSCAFLVSNADAYTLDATGMVATWPVLSVLYCDDQDARGEVFSMHAEYDIRDGSTRLTAASIVNVVDVETEPGQTVWRHPVTTSEILRMRDAKPEERIRNMWYLFRGVLLPMLYCNAYRFVFDPHDKVIFQAQMLRQICEAYQGLVA